MRKTNSSRVSCWSSHRRTHTELAASSYCTESFLFLCVPNTLRLCAALRLFASVFWAHTHQSQIGKIVSVCVCKPDERRVKLMRPMSLAPCNLQKRHTALNFASRRVRLWSVRTHTHTLARVALLAPRCARWLKLFSIRHRAS